MMHWRERGVGVWALLDEACKRRVVNRPAANELRTGDSDLVEINCYGLLGISA